MSWFGIHLRQGCVQVDSLGDHSSKYQLGSGRRGRAEKEANKSLVIKQVSTKGCRTQSHWKLQE
jgi:hypothetical protein